MIGYTPKVGDIVSLTAHDGTLMTVVSVLPNNQQVICQRGNYQLAFNILRISLAQANTGDATAVLTATAGGGNTGTGVVTATAVSDGRLWNSLTHTITFTSGVAYKVTDSTGAQVSSGAYSNPTEIKFKGVKVTIGGAPNTNDTFVMTPTSYVAN